MEAPASCEQYTHNNIKQKRINAEKSFQGLLPELFLLTFNWFIDFLLVWKAVMKLATHQFTVNRIPSTVRSKSYCLLTKLLALVKTHLDAVRELI